MKSRRKASQILQSEGHRPRKRYGQHFLHDRTVIARIIEALSPSKVDDLLEIGPGEGALTADLLAASRTLHVVEIDTDLAEALNLQFGSNKNFHLHIGDALDFDLRTIVSPPAALRIVGNLPYNISTPILFRLLNQTELISDMHFMLQREVVERMAAAPGSSSYGRLSVMLQSRCKVQQLFTVGSGAFRPSPKVESAMVRLVPYRCSHATQQHWALFSKIVHDAFVQRRKMLSNSLGNYLSAAELAGIGIDPKRRAETLSLDEYRLLCSYLTEKRKT